MKVVRITSDKKLGNSPTHIAWSRRAILLIILKVSHVFIRNSCITLLLPERVLPTLTAKISIISETTKFFVRKFECNAFTTSIQSQSPMPANSESEAYGPAVRSLRTEGYDVSRRRTSLWAENPFLSFLISHSSFWKFHSPHSPNRAERPMYKGLKAREG